MSTYMNHASVIDGIEIATVEARGTGQSELAALDTDTVDYEVALDNAVERFEEEARINFEEVALPRYLETAEEKLDDKGCERQQLCALELEARREFEEAELPNMVMSFAGAFAESWRTEG